jgi:hypothetical protein
MNALSPVPTEQSNVGSTTVQDELKEIKKTISLGDSSVFQLVG